ncbi:MAG: hypothetical protein H6589_02775 [Flavobacteriales bacterium]|nr:hypothetical protein [Flavobacteriales bacterium]
MNEEYIDQFLKTGRLKLSSYESNRKTEDKIRQDDFEGYHTYRILNRNRTNGAELKVNDRDVHRILCCSLEFDKKFYCNYFKVDGCMEISNAFAFGYEIAKVLEEYGYGMEGLVDYVDEKINYLLLEQFPELPDLPNEPKMQDLFIYIDAITRLDPGPFYKKPKKFIPEKEYRITWKCKANHDIFIDCPGAIKYCKKI